MRIKQVLLKVEDCQDEVNQNYGAARVRKLKTTDTHDCRDERETWEFHLSASLKKKKKRFTGAFKVPFSSPSLLPS